jgi:hypothetical protein
MAHAQKPDFVFRRNGRVHLNQRGRQFSQLLAAEVCASAVVILNTPCSEVVWRVLATHSIRQFPLHFPTRASRCAITFQLDSTSLHLLKRTRGRDRTNKYFSYIRQGRRNASLHSPKVIIIIIIIIIITTFIQIKICDKFQKNFPVTNLIKLPNEGTR